MLADQPDQGPQTAGRKQQRWHGRPSVDEVLGPGTQNLLPAAAGQLNTQVWVAVAHAPPGHADDLPTCPSRRTAAPFVRGPSLCHSAHVGQEVVVHYRWHPLHGCRLHCHPGKRRSGHGVVHVGVAPGIVMVVAAWMLDLVACAGMEVGPPCAAVPALADLHRLLTALGFRTDSQGDSTVALGNSDEASTAERAEATAPDDDGAGRQEAMGNDSG